MKIRLPVVRRALLLLTALLPLANCSTVSRAPESPGTAYVQPVPGRSEGTAAGPAPVAPMMVEESSPVARSRRFGTDAHASEMIDRLIAGKAKQTGDRSPGATNRPGLATQAGDERWDKLTQTTFYRKTSGAPDAVDSFNYNDEAGAKAMAEALGSSRLKSGTFEAAGGRLEVALCQLYSNTPLERYEATGRRIVIGRDGTSYKILLKNPTRHHLEVVASVDGLDVMDGKTASTRKRGYILPAKSEIVISGFRISQEHVREFVFGSVENSAAAKAGTPRNVGVIGLAVYEEDEAQAKLARLVEARKRGAASAFPVGAR